MHEFFASMDAFLKDGLPEDTEAKGSGVVARIRLELMAAIIASGMANKNTGVNDRDKFAEVSVAIAEEICREVRGIPTRDDDEPV
jgi:hypothetical protein